MMEQVLYLIVSFTASIVGAICGIGGGVLIKPTLDFFQFDNIAVISFLSGCTVLSMSCYSVSKTLLSGESKIQLKTGTPLAIGAAIGGIIGKQLFSYINILLEETAGAVQAGCLFLITLATLIYTLRKSKIRTLQVESMPVCLGIGLALGIMSSFLGIGGGPINLVVFFYFFSMDTKIAAQNSLYIILISQIASLITSFVTHSIPAFSPVNLIFMICGGIAGGIVGRKCNKKMDNHAVDRLFVGLMIVILLICLYNVYLYK